MTDPASMIVAAFVAGAANGIAEVGEQAVADAYAALKTLVKASYSSATRLFESISALEAQPDSEGRKITLAEELQAVGATSDKGLIAAAEAMRRAVVDAQATTGLDWTDIQAGNIKLGKVRAHSGSVGVRALGIRASGDITIGDIEAGNASGN